MDVVFWTYKDVRYLWSDAYRKRDKNLQVPGPKFSFVGFSSISGIFSTRTVPSDFGSQNERPWSWGVYCRAESVWKSFFHNKLTHYIGEPMQILSASFCIWRLLLISLIRRMSYWRTNTKSLFRYMFFSIWDLQSRQSVYP